MKIFKLKPNKKEKLLAWGKELSTTRREAAIASLHEEQCTHELVYLFSMNGESYIGTHMEGNDILPANNSELNRAHKAIWAECVGEEIPISEIYDLKQ